ncbi:sulfurtransferase complex subunit TusB [Magnetospirillum sulfuroxidans]|uniref:Sulfurtransferase complex subunit TusB n=1 Tax=Magnetospirillum sulfuroxidans TaxID=611300 RepID=A0ABS5IE21_9PROT|nr:sulfurtransferase complex subunit TusB [Magnetospirillum sulfuroxidans]MBR9972417.1 sulfurtransferase complex subunit TusB [Magnetospirillum sulfuroxidans]
MSTLHTVNKSPFERSNLQACLGHAQNGDSVLLIEDAVFAAIAGNTFAPKLADAAQDIKLFVLGPDLKARGMDPAKVVDGVNIIDYEGFVDLAAASSTIHSWL